MNIACFGCSWTSGLHYGDYKGFADTGDANWVCQLSKLMPEHNFYNFSFPGSSVLHSINMLNQVKNCEFLKIDKIIFQVTNEGRFTYYKDLNYFWCTSDRIIKKEDNYYYFHLTFNEVWTINYGTLNDKNFQSKEYLDRYTLAKLLYNRFTPGHNFCIEHRIHIDWLKENTDLLFFHRKDFCNINDIFSIQNVLDEETWKKFVCDDGDHFNTEGCKWQANYIKNLLF